MSDNAALTQIPWVSVQMVVRRAGGDYREGRWRGYREGRWRGYREGRWRLQGG